MLITPLVSEAHCGCSSAHEYVITITGQNCVVLKWINHLDTGHPNCLADSGFLVNSVFKFQFQMCVDQETRTIYVFGGQSLINTSADVSPIAAAAAAAAGTVSPQCTTSLCTTISTYNAMKG